MCAFQMQMIKRQERKKRFTCRKYSPPMRQLQLWWSDFSPCVVTWYFPCPITENGIAVHLENMISFIITFSSTSNPTRDHIFMIISFHSFTKHVVYSNSNNHIQIGNTNRKGIFHTVSMIEFDVLRI